MKSRKKKIIGLLGLFGVAAVTTLAVLLPQTGVSAASSATDKISVTVEHGTPLIEITKPQNYERLSGPNLELEIRREKLSGGKIIVERVDGGGGDPLTFEFTADYDSGTRTFYANLEEKFPEGFGYGTYKITATGSAYGSDNADNDVKYFTYNALNPGGTGGTTPGGETDPGKNPEFKTDPSTGDPIVDPGVDSDNQHVSHTHVTITPTSGEGKNPDGAQSSLEHNIPKGETWQAPFTEDCLPAGWYYILLEAKGEDGQTIGQPEEVWFYWRGSETCGLPVANLGSPNTGGLFNGANISREDALLTGLVVFLVAAALGTFLIVRRKKATVKRNRR